MPHSPFSPIDRKIDPSRRPARPAKPDGSPDDNDRIEIGPTPLAFREWEELGLTVPQLDRMRAYRLDRLTAELKKRDYGGLLLFDPLNIRYATDTTNMQLWVAHNPTRACFVSADGHIVLWDFHNCAHLSSHLPLIKDVRIGASFFYFEDGSRVDEQAAKFAAQVDDLMRVHCGGNRRLAVDKIEFAGLRALEALGLEVMEGQEVTEHARLIKSADELAAMRCSIAACEAAMDEMKVAMKPGVTENDIWAELHAGNIRRGGEWIETRLLSSGPRTNPWFQECGPRVVEEGDLVAFDTDLIGPYGICCDISRTWLCGEGMPSNEQRHLYQLAYEHLLSNRELLRPGLTFRELAATAHRLPEEYRAYQYSSVCHGVGLCDEYPSIPYIDGFESGGYDGVFEPNMVVCVEAYVGAVGGRNGIKLENQVLITEDGYEDLTSYPFEEDFLR